MGPAASMRSVMDRLTRDEGRIAANIGKLRAFIERYREAKGE